MGEEERRRKIILDQANGMIQQIECMRNTLLLARGAGSGHTDDAMVQRFIDKVNAVTSEASAIEDACSGDRQT